MGIRWAALIGLALVCAVGGCDRGGTGEEESGCTADADCPEGVCNEGACVECAEDGDCESGICDVAAGTCIECVEDAQCATGAECELAVCIDGECSVEIVPGCGQSADADEDGWSEDEGDCDDNDPDVNPGAEEACNGKDDDCDGEVDEGCDPALCVENDDCGEGEFCKLEACDDPKGLCEPRPEGCDKVYLPVCGCDSQTWGNECEAWMSGVSVDYEGECEVAPLPCEENGDCGAGAWCIKAAGDCEGEGQCVPLPGGDCPAVWMPVCGCDGVTYGNDCEAASAGVNVDFEGECEVMPPICETDGDCDEGAYCAKDVGECEGVGICEEKPMGCGDVWDPVCGCDGETYGNGCEAAAAGVSVDYDGECGVEEGCWADDMCAPGEFCFYPGCGAKSGDCIEIPQICPAVWDPVCGCDGETYGNLCTLMAAGQSMDYEGECAP